MASTAELDGRRFSLVFDLPHARGRGQSIAGAGDSLQVSDGLTLLVKTLVCALALLGEKLQGFAGLICRLWRVGIGCGRRNIVLPPIDSGSIFNHHYPPANWALDNHGRGSDVVDRKRGRCSHFFFPPLGIGGSGNQYVGLIARWVSRSHHSIWLSGNLAHEAKRISPPATTTGTSSEDK